MAQYTCTQCRWTLETPLCPGCNQFMTDDIELVESFMGGVDLPERPITWTTAFGHWGDAFMCAGVMKAMLKHTGQPLCNVLYVGPDPSIADWFREQEFVCDVIAVKITGVDVYPRFWQIAARPGTEPADWLAVIQPIEPNLPDPCKVTQTHINMKWFHKQAVQLWHDAKLPESARRWARNASIENGLDGPGKVIHIHPVSTWSETSQNHWPHWKAAIERLLLTTPHTYVVTGLQPIDRLCENHRLVNMIGKTPGNMEMLALSERCDAVISTPNNVALWSVIQKQKAFCVGNMASKFITSYYTRFLMRGERMKYMGVDTEFDDFLNAVYPWLEEVEPCPIR